MEKTKEMVSFSIIVPVYNVEKYLPECVESLLNQQNVEYEILFVDDGSTDNSGELCDSYAKEYEKIRVVHKQNGGLSEARNTGVKLAKNEYIIFVDSDDYIGKDSLWNIQNVILLNNRPDLIFLECMKVFDKTQKKVPLNDGVTKVVDIKRGDALREYIAHLPKFPASACSKAICRDFFGDNNLYFKKGILCEDLEWAVRLFLATRTAAYCSTPHYYYRQNRVGSISNSPNLKMAMDVLEIVEQLRQLENTQSNSSNGYMIRSIMEYLFRFLCIHTLRVPKEKRRVYIRRVKQCDYVIGTRKDTASRMCAIAYKFFGVKKTGQLLQLYLRIR